MKFRELSTRLWGNTKKSRRGRNTKRNTPHWQSSSLRLERLESRIALSVDPVLSVGLNPNDFMMDSLGVFDPVADVVIDTDALTISGLPGTTGTTQLANVGFGSYQIAVFTFDSFELDAGVTLTATGSRPLALLSLNNLTVSGTIDVSAEFNLLGGRVAGPGGGDGGDGFSTGFQEKDGYPAAGAPALSVGQLEEAGSGGSGGGFGGAGGHGGRQGSASGVGGIAYADLDFAVQGGSGGSAAGLGANGNTFLVSGGGGGGGIELGAVLNVTINTTGVVLANGGAGKSTAHFASPGGGGGGGAGGGILVHGTDVTQNGMLLAEGGIGGNGFQRGGGGGGGEILIAHSNEETFVHGGTESVLGGTTVVGNIEVDGQDGNVTVLLEVQPVEIDIRPGSDSNVVSLMGNGQIAVAIITTDLFDAAQVNASSVIFAGAFANNSVLEDVDGDGDLDLLLHFRIADTNLQEIYAGLLADDLKDDEDGILDSNRQEAEVTLTGETVDQVMIEGMDKLDLFLAGKRLRDLLDELAAAGVI